MILIDGYIVFIFITHVFLHQYIISLYFKLHFPIVQYNDFVARVYNSMMEPDYGNYCYYYKDSYVWHGLVVVTDVEDNCSSFYFGISYFVYPYRILRYHWDFLINSISIVFCAIVLYMFLQNSCTPDITSPWFLFLLRCLSSCKCRGLMLLCLTLLILLFPSKLLRLWLIFSTSWWYWSFLGVMPDKKTSHLNFLLYSSGNNFSLYAISFGY